MRASRSSATAPAQSACDERKTSKTRGAFMTRKVGLVGIVCMTAIVVAVSAQAPGGRGGPASMTLPLANLGLEHLDIVVPDTAESAKFYMRIFKAPLHQQPVRDTLRYFLVLGDVPADRQVGYVAVGGARRAPGRDGSNV